MDRHVCGSDGEEGDGSQGLHWACPFYLSNPIRHEACVAYKLRRVADIRQHIKRKHATEAGERMKEMKKKGDRGQTNKDRWYALWTLFFPGQVRPTTPFYTGTGFADLTADFVSRFMEERKVDGMSGDVKRALMGYVAFVTTTSREMKSGGMSVQAVADVNVHQLQDTGIQDSNTYQGVPLLPNSLGGMMGPPQQPDPRDFFAGYYDIQTSNVPTQSQAPSIPAANNQCWPRIADPAAYSAVSAHQLFPVQSLYAAALNGPVDDTPESSDVSAAMDWAWWETGHDGDAGQFDFGHEN